ncbi:MAG: hypothetical protein AAGC55_23985, partial [Myxococcota bacterium]
APELHMLYQLEKVYGIPRSNRFVRVPPEDILPPIADPTDDDAMVDIELHLHAESGQQEVAVDIDQVAARDSGTHNIVELADLSEVTGPDIEVTVEVSADPAVPIPEPGPGSGPDDDEIAIEMVVDDDAEASFADVAEALREPVAPVAEPPPGGEDEIAIELDADDFEVEFGDDALHFELASEGVDDNTAADMAAANEAAAAAAAAHAASLAARAKPSGPAAPRPQTSRIRPAPPPIPSERSSTAVPSDQPERRQFVKTLSDVPSGEVHLARIPIKRVHSPSGGAVAPPPAPVSVPSTLDGAFRAVRQATGRDRVGDLVVSAMRDFFDHAFDAGLILVVRTTIAIGWKGFVRDGSTDAIESVAIPLSTPSVVSDSYRQGKISLGAPDGGGTQIDRRLWSLLRATAPATVAVAPVVLNGQTVCLLYAHSQRPADDIAAVVGDDLATLAQCTSKAFARLIRAAQR